MRKNLTQTYFTILVFSCCCLQGRGQAHDSLKVASDSIKAYPLKTVTVLGKATVRRNSTYQFSTAEAKQLVTVVGETDVLRYIGTLPGVSQGMEAGLGFFIRGSNSGNNRFLLDDVPVYGSDHLFGLFSVFHPDIVENVDFRSGKFPASSGNFLSSLTRISTVTPSSKTHGGSLSVSPFMVGGSLNAPLFKGKGSFQVAGRISLLRPEIALIKKIAETEGDLVPEVGDLYAKFHYQADINNQIDAAIYYSNDYFKYVSVDDDQNNTVEQNWGNKIASLTWHRELPRNMHLRTSAYYNYFLSGQRQQYTEKGTQSSDLHLQTSIREWDLKSILRQKTNDIQVEAGIEARLQRIQPGSEKIYTSTQKTNPDQHYSYNPASATRNFSVFSEVEYKHQRITYLLGYRGSYYASPTVEKLCHDLRISATAETTKETGVELSFDRLTQFQHVVEGLPVGWSLDLIIPSDSLRIPELAHQLYAGGFWSRNQFHASFGIYYKKMNHLASYRNATNVFGVQNTNWSDEVASGKGTSYGMEVRLERKGDNWNAALSYTLSKTTRQYNEMNEGKAFPFKFDRRHILNIAGQIRIKETPRGSRHLNFGLAFSSGHHATIPIGMYKGIEPPFWSQQSGNNVTTDEQQNALYRQLMSHVNGYTFPYYFRIDLGYNIHKKRKRTTTDLDIGIFNILNRKNPYLIFYEDDQWKQLSIFPIVPSVKWRLSF